MLFVSLPLMVTWLLGLVSLGLFGGGVYLLWASYVGVLEQPAWLLVSLLTTLWTFAGRWIVLRLRRPAPDEPRHARRGLVDLIERMDGSGLHVELDGPVDGPPVVLTHTEGMTSTAWHYQKRRLAERFRSIVWDLPGCGRSRGPATGDYRLEKLARDLDAVVALAGGRPAILVGHGLGGVVALAFCALFPEKVGREVAGLVLIDTPHPAPGRPTRGARTAHVLGTLGLMAMLHATIWLSPLLMLMSWLAYHNGLLHLGAMVLGFAGRESRGQLDFAASFVPLASPATRARMALAMRRRVPASALARIDVPTIVVTGDSDRLAPPDAARRLASALPRATLLTLRPAGHLSPIEQHESLNRALVAFTSEHGAVDLGSASRRRR